MELNVCQGVRIKTIMNPSFRLLNVSSGSNIMERDIVNDMCSVMRRNWLRRTCAGSGTMTTATFVAIYQPLETFLEKRNSGIACLNVPQYRMSFNFDHRENLKDLLEGATLMISCNKIQIAFNIFMLVSRHQI